LKRQSDKLLHFNKLMPVSMQNDATGIRPKQNATVKNLYARLKSFFAVSYKQRNTTNDYDRKM